MNLFFFNIFIYEKIKSFMYASHKIAIFIIRQKTWQVPLYNCTYTVQYVQYIYSYRYKIGKCHISFEHLFYNIFVMKL
jgi:hypothetical protein